MQLFVPSDVVSAGQAMDAEKRVRALRAASASAAIALHVPVGGMAALWQMVLTGADNPGRSLQAWGD
jgi:hypothetical protein